MTSPGEQGSFGHGRIRTKSSRRTRCSPRPPSYRSRVDRSPDESVGIRRDSSWVGPAEHGTEKRQATGSSRDLPESSLISDGVVLTNTEWECARPAAGVHAHPATP